MQITKNRSIRFINTIIVCICILCFLPNMGNGCNLMATAIGKSSFLSDCDLAICNLTNQISRGDIEGILQQLEIVTEILEKSDDAITDSCVFLKNFIDRVNSQFGTSLTLSQVLQCTKESIYKTSISDAEIENYFLGLNLLRMNYS